MSGALLETNMTKAKFDREKLERLRSAVDAATDDVIEFEGVEYYIDYARYLIQYLDGRLNV